MNKLMCLIRINLKNVLSLNSQMNSKNTKKKKIGITLLFAYLLIYFIIYSFVISSSAIKGLIKLNAPYILPVMFMVLSSLVTIIMDVFRVNGHLFKTKDYDLLSSLPIKTDYIILSKLVSIYLENLLITTILMVPAFIIYVINIKVTFLFYLYYLLTMFVIPVIPLIISTIIGTVITYISSLFRYKNILNLVLSLGIITLYFMISFSVDGMNADAIANLGMILVDKFNKFYPLTNVYLNIIKDYNILATIIYLVMPILVSIIYLLVMKKIYYKINTRLFNEKTVSNYKVTSLNRSSILKALFKKDVKRFYSSYLYVLNCCVGALLLTMLVISMVLLGGDSINKIMESTAIVDLVQKFTPFLIGAAVLLNSTTQCSISIEGKTISILKSLPISPNKIFLSKILTNFTVFVPMIFINGTIIAVYFKFSFIKYLLTLFIPLLYGLFISLFGLIINLHFPMFDFDSEAKVIKQSVSVVITLMCGVILGVLPLVLLVSKNLNISIFTIIIIIVLSIIDIIMIIYLKTKGNKIYNEL